MSERGRSCANNNYARGVWSCREEQLGEEEAAAAGLNASVFSSGGYM